MQSLCAKARSSGGERYLDAVEVGGSNPPAPTIWIRSDSPRGSQQIHADFFVGYRKRTMSNMQSVFVTLPDGNRREVPPGTTVREVAEQISPGLARRALAARVNGDEVDLSYKLESDQELKILTPEDPESGETPSESELDLYSKLGLGDKEATSLWRKLSAIRYGDIKGSFRAGWARGYEGLFDGLIEIKRLEEKAGVGLGADVTYIGPDGNTKTGKDHGNSSYGRNISLSPARIHIPCCEILVTSTGEVTLPCGDEFIMMTPDQ